MDEVDRGHAKEPLFTNPEGGRKKNEISLSGKLVESRMKCADFGFDKHRGPTPKEKMTPLHTGFASQSSTGHSRGRR